MESKQKTIRSYFARLNLDPLFADIYLCLFIKGPQSLSELSRNTKIERTKLYRLLDELKASSLVEVDSVYKRQLLRAVPLHNLEILIAKREEDLQALKAELPSIEKLLSESILKSQETRIQFYHGIDGVKQILWNQTKAQGPVDSMLHDNMQINTGEAFFVRWAQRCNETNVARRSLVNDRFLESQQIWYASHSNERLRNWQGRYVAHEIFSLNHSTVIYDDVVAFYDWSDDELFGIEIHNKEIADSQRSFFEMLWQQGTTLES